MKVAVGCRPWKTLACSLSYEGTRSNEQVAENEKGVQRGPPPPPWFLLLMDIYVSTQNSHSFVRYKARYQNSTCVGLEVLGLKCFWALLLSLNILWSVIQAAAPWCSSSVFVTAQHLIVRTYHKLLIHSTSDGLFILIYTGAQIYEFWSCIGYAYLTMSWWWTGRPGVLQFMVSQSWTWLSNWTELNLTIHQIKSNYYLSIQCQ